MVFVRISHQEFPGIHLLSLFATAFPCPDYLRQNRHPRLGCPSARALAPRSWCNWLICWSLVVVCVTRSLIRASNAAIKAPLLLRWSWAFSGGSVASGSHIFHFPFTFLPSSAPVRSLRLMVSWLSPIWVAAWAIVRVCIGSLVPRVGVLGKSLGNAVGRCLGIAYVVIGQYLGTFPRRLSVFFPPVAVPRW